MTTTAQAALSSGFAALQVQLGRSFRFGTRTFTALVGTPIERRAGMGNDLSAGFEHDTILECLTTDLPTLPTANAVLEDVATGEKLLVSGVSKPLGHKVSLYCRREVAV